MGTLTIEFDLDEHAVILLDNGRISAALGEGVRMMTEVPKWVEGIRSAKLQLVLDVDGSPHANTERAPIE